MFENISEIELINIPLVYVKIYLALIIKQVQNTFILSFKEYKTPRIALGYNILRNNTHYFIETNKPNLE